MPNKSQNPQNNPQSNPQNPNWFQSTNQNSNTSAPYTQGNNQSNSQANNPTYNNPNGVFINSSIENPNPSQNPNSNNPANPSYPQNYQASTPPTSGSALQPINQPNQKVNTQNNSTVNQANLYNSNSTNPNPINQTPNPKEPLNPGQQNFNSQIAPGNNFQIPGQPKPVNKQQNLKQKSPFKLLPFLKKWWWAVTAGVLILCILIITSILFFNNPEDTEVPAYDRVEATITGPSEAPSGTPINLSVRVENQEDVALENVVVDIQTPDSFKYIDTLTNLEPSSTDPLQFQLGRLDSKNSSTSSFVIQFQGVLVDNPGENAPFTGVVNYTPSPLSGTENSVKTIDIQAISVQVGNPTITMNMSPDAAVVQNGGQVKINLNFENISDQSISDLRLRMEYPSGSGINFSYDNSQLVLNNNPVTTPTNGNNQWDITELTTNRRQDLQVVGNVFGKDESILKFRAYIEARQTDNSYIILQQTETEIKIARQPLLIETTITNKEADKLFSAGETLTFNIAYSNQGETTLRNVEIITSIEDPAGVLDYNSIQYVGGVRGNTSNRTVTWQARNTQQLENVNPGAGGNLRFSIQTQKEGSFTTSGLNQSSYFITPKVEVKAENLQSVIFTGSQYKATGDMTFEQSFEALDSETLNNNQAIYRVKWELSTLQNAVNGVVVETKSALPDSSFARLNITPESQAENFSYNDETGEIIWNPGNIEGYLGINNRAKLTLTFEIFVEVEPGQSLRGIELFEGVKYFGTDDYTGQTYEDNLDGFEI